MTRLTPVGTPFKEKCGGFVRAYIDGILYKITCTSISGTKTVSLYRYENGRQVPVKQGVRVNDDSCADVIERFVTDPISTAMELVLDF
jgi:hypothetical protein